MDNIKDKIRALMSKTVENGCTEEEAMAAAQKVAEMLRKYQLDLSDIRIKEESKCATGSYDTGLKGKGPLDCIILDIARFTDTKCWREIYPKVSYKYFGLEHDVMIAEYITKICEWAIIWAAEDFKATEAYQNSYNRAKILLDFKFAMAYRLATRIREMKKVIVSSGRDLVPVKNAIIDPAYAALNLKLRSSKARGHSFSSGAAIEAGRAAGDKVQLNPGVTKEYGNAHAIQKA